MGTGKKFTAYITKYALTKGIIEKEVEELSATHVKGDDHFEYYHKPYWWDTLYAAKIHAEELKTNKLNSLKKQFDKIIKLKF